MTNEQRGEQSSRKDKGRQTGRSDTLAAGGSQPVDAPPSPPGAQSVGAHGGTDAAAGAQLSGSKGGPGGPSLREQSDAAGVPGAPGGSMGAGGSPAAGASGAGGTGLGEAASADDTQTGTGTAPGHTTPMAGGDPSSPATPHPGNKGGASSA
ncbi:MAG: hypothetical protein ABIT83_03790 [Massilia sp.]